MHGFGGRNSQGEIGPGLTRNLARLVVAEIALPQRTVDDKWGYINRNGVSGTGALTNRGLGAALRVPDFSSTWITSGRPTSR